MRSSRACSVSVPPGSSIRRSEARREDIPWRLPVLDAREGQFPSHASCLAGRPAAQRRLDDRSTARPSRKGGTADDTVSVKRGLGVGASGQLEGNPVGPYGAGRRGNRTETEGDAIMAERVNVMAEFASEPDLRHRPRCFGRRRSFAGAALLPCQHRLQRAD